MNLGQLTRSGFKSASPDFIACARETFAAKHCVLFERFLEPWLIDWALRDLERASFRPRVGEGDWGEKKPSVDERLDEPNRWGALLFAFNDPVLFALVERLTGCGPIGSFSGVVYRMVPGRGHAHSWHNDLDRDRLVALSVNLSPRGYRGGRLQLADAASSAIVHDVANTGLGDAIIFELSSSLVHRVTDVEGVDPKVSFAGWFLRQPAYASWLRRA
jgi:2-oxoglutarate-Fe(II)-dependent oxygenase superfamily protein